MRLNFIARSLMFLALTGAFFAPQAFAAPTTTRALIRYPTVHGSTIVFEAGGALWKVSTQGGVAVRLTADSGYDSHPVISPNGQWIAFTGWYRGNTDVYVMPVNGGAVRQLTWRSVNYAGRNGVVTGRDNIVMGWSPDSRDVIFLSRRLSFNFQVMRAFEVPVTGGLPTALPMPWAGPLTFNATGTALIYDKSARILREFHRKNYQGGSANALFEYVLPAGQTTQLTHWKGENTWPMWVRNTLYYASDKDSKVLNLWEKNLGTGASRQITHFTTYDIDWPSASAKSLVFSDGGELYQYVFKTRTLKRIPVSVPLDGAHRLSYELNVSQEVQSATFAPNGIAGIFSAHGGLFLVPMERSATRALGAKAGSNYKDPSWSPKGALIAYIDDTGRTSRVAVRNVTAGSKPVYVTPLANKTYSGPLVWSPNGRYLTYTTSNDSLWLINLKSGKTVKIARDTQVIVHGFADATFSPDSRFLAFSMHLPNFMRALFIYDLKTGVLHQLSRGVYSDKDPVFSRNGKYLFFTSARLVNVVASHYGTEAAGADPDGLYVTTLSSTTPSLFAPREIWSTPTYDDLQACDKASKAPTPLAKHVTIDFKGLIERAVEVPVAATTIKKIAEAGGVLYYQTAPTATVGAHLPRASGELHAYCLKGRRDRVIAKKVTGRFQLSVGGVRLFFQNAGTWFVQYADFKVPTLYKSVDLNNMQLLVNPVAEWHELYWEAWRNVRDYFVDPAVIRERWTRIGRRYAALLPLVQDREDLSYLIDNMIGSLGESHLYFYGRNPRGESATNPTAGLGAIFALDVKTGTYYIKRIYHGNNTLPGYYAPLSQPGLKVKEGDTIVAIDGQALKAPTNPYSLLQGSHGQDITLTLAKTPQGKPWTIIVQPVGNSIRLHLLHWIRHNRKEVNRLSGGKIGYVYLNDMDSRGLHEFVRQFYWQIDKKAIILDTRWNLGGYVNTLLFNELLAKSITSWAFRSGEYYPAPQASYSGKLALVVNQGTSSDADIFAYRFKRYHLGPVIGTRTWGGVRGFFKPFTLLDGAHEFISEEALYRNGHWVVEGEGVRPDVREALDPGLWARAGKDSQLEAAVRTLEEELKKQPPKNDAPPAWLPAFPSRH